MTQRGRALLGSVFTTALLAGALAPGEAQAFRTPFGDRVYNGVERGLAWIRAQEANGNYFQWYTPLGGLALLEARQNANWQAPTRGYTNSSPDDQARLVRMARATIEFDPALQAAGGAFSTGTGAGLMFLAQFRRTGGPDNVGAAIGIDRALANGAAALQASQANNAANCDNGGWSPNAPDGTGDILSTQFAAAGLAAAASTVPTADDNLPRAATYLRSLQAANGGFAYKGCQAFGPASGPTAAGLWSLRVIGLGVNQANVQSAATWLQANFRDDAMIVTNANEGTYSYYQTLFSTAKGLELLIDNGQPGIYEDDIGGLRVPATDGYPEEPPGWYYDFAYHLVTRQEAGGTFPAPPRTPAPHRRSTTPTRCSCWSVRSAASAPISTPTAPVPATTTAPPRATRTRPIAIATASATSATTARTPPTPIRPTTITTGPATPATTTCANPPPGVSSATAPTTTAISASTRATPKAAATARPTSRAPADPAC
jgi:hypothetical protein